jgi:hypothetical protein
MGVSASDMARRASNRASQTLQTYSYTGIVPGEYRGSDRQHGGGPIGNKAACRNGRGGRAGVLPTPGAGRPSFLVVASRYRRRSA